MQGEFEHACISSLAGIELRLIRLIDATLEAFDGHAFSTSKVMRMPPGRPCLRKMSEKIRCSWGQG